MVLGVIAVVVRHLDEHPGSGTDPHAIFGTRTGPWKMRARIDAPKSGGFSPEVPFQYVLQSPALTAPSKAPVETAGPVR